MSDDRPVRAWLSDARIYADEARRIAHSKGEASLDRRDYLAIRYCLMVVGEALDWVPVDIFAREPAIPWRRIIALRHRLVHGYWLIDEDLLTEIARNETERLISSLDRLISSVR